MPFSFESRIQVHTQRVKETIQQFEENEKNDQFPKLRPSSALVTIELVSDGKVTPFQVHKDFLCYYSPVFRSAFGSPFIEGLKQTYKLEDTTEDAVFLLIHWLYTQRLDLIQDMKLFREEFACKDGPPKRMPVKDKEDRALVALWALADRLLIPSLQNIIVDKIEQMPAIFNTMPLIYKSIYEQTYEGSALRRLIVDLFCHEMPSSCWKAHARHYPHEMLIDVATFYSTRYIAGQGKKHYGLRDMSQYHAKLG
ncbi:hypothetical protein BP5796_10699 [Coleophoma crateriformis]|uniref:BTB domain-containing protein n=1 Tax=Coleophoma crateriformis TaxID=565419 RepID=A0A3D8QQZ5_9HELO|nr:hypothetical protein BP5796_10699 [Coleophoma crateriformis]